MSTMVLIKIFLFVAGRCGLDFLFVAGQCGPDQCGAGQDMSKYAGQGGLRAE